MKSVIFAVGAAAVAGGSESGVGLLFLQPAKEFLVARIGQDFFDCVVFVAQLIVRPGFVDEIFAGAASRDCFAAAFASRHDVMVARGDVAITEGTFFGHSICHATGAILP